MMSTTLARVTQMLDAAQDAYVERELAWLPHDRRGRWVVLEPGPGYLLTEVPRWMRRRVDAVTPRRGRRFSSLSRARAFARQVSGTVHRWRRISPGGKPWHRESPWERCLSSIASMGWIARSL